MFSSVLSDEPQHKRVIGKHNYVKDYGGLYGSIVNP